MVVVLLSYQDHEGRSLDPGSRERRDRAAESGGRVKADHLRFATGDGIAGGHTNRGVFMDGTDVVKVVREVRREGDLGRPRIPEPGGHSQLGGELEDCLADGGRGY